MLHLFNHSHHFFQQRERGGGTCIKRVGSLASEPKEKRESHERDKEVSKSWAFSITSVHFFHAISSTSYSFAWNSENFGC